MMGHQNCNWDLLSAIKAFQKELVDRDTHWKLLPICAIPKKSSIGFFGYLSNQHMGISKNKGTPKWMVYNGKPY